MVGKTRTFPLRLAEELHKWLKENVKEQTINEFIVSLIKEKIESLKVAEKLEEPEKPKSLEGRADNPDEIKALLSIRSSFMLRAEHSKHGFTLSSPKDVKNLKYGDAFECLEKYYFDMEWFDSKIIEALRDRVEKKACENYFDRGLKMSLKDRSILYNEIRTRERWNRYRGDPDEVVYKDITREDIYSAFSKDKRYTTTAIAAVLHLTYMQAYMNVVPWMKGEGFHVQ